jgi:predicted metalloprotease with PDZ domain
MMMIRSLLLLCLGIFTYSISQASDTCRVEIDLKKVVEDRVKVIIYPPALSGKMAEFVMPAVVPGTYDMSDFGRFVHEIVGFDKAGKKVKAKKVGLNVFQFPNPANLERIEYWIDDSWDYVNKKEKNRERIFEPGGTNIDEDRIFLLNWFGFVGYFEGYYKTPYRISVTHPEEMHGSTALQVERGIETDIMRASNYGFLADNPMMYCEPDTLSFMVAKTRVEIALFSRDENITAKNIKEAIDPLAQGLKNFFGELPVDHYTFLFMVRPKVDGVEGNTINMSDNMSEKELLEYLSNALAMLSERYGALEHSYSSVYYLLADSDPKAFKETVQAVAGHEFLHILTPLNIHSEEIENFNFRAPKMSKHLWMYEGVTEYFAQYILAREKMLKEEEFMEEMLWKIKTANRRSAISFTEMSQNVLLPEYNKEYDNVYNKGAMMGMLIDLHLLDRSKGEMGLPELMMKLAKKYGPNKPFKDDDLIPEIVAMTFPDLQDFFTTYVIGKDTLPYKKYFPLIGWEYYHNEEIELLSFGDFEISTSPVSGKVWFSSTQNFKNRFGVEGGDLLLEVNGIKVRHNSDSLLNLLEKPENDASINITYEQSGQKKTAKARPVKKKFFKKDYIHIKKDLSPEQIAFRKRYFGW